MFSTLGNTEMALNFKDFQLYEKELNEHRKQINTRYQLRLNSEPAAKNSPHSVADPETNKKTLLNIELKKNSLSNIRSQVARFVEHKRERLHRKGAEASVFVS